MSFQNVLLVGSATLALWTRFPSSLVREFIGSRSPSGVTCECTSPGTFGKDANGYRCSDPTFDGSCGKHEACLIPLGRVWRPGAIFGGPCGGKRLASIMRKFGAYAPINEHSACARTMLGVSMRDARLCELYDSQELSVPNCTNLPDIVPSIIHSVGRSTTSSLRARLLHGDSSFIYNRHDDLSAGKYIAEKCGERAYKAYECLGPGSFRADVFRFCALSADGGVYLDEDIVPLHPLADVVSFCSVATVGHDFPTGGLPAKQMKILASAPSAPILTCALEQIVSNVEHRRYPSSPLALTGPLLLQECFQLHSENVAVTYKDTHQAMWPYTGLRAGNKILAFEYPYSSKYFCKNEACKTGEDDYATMFKAKKIYRESCEL